MVKHLYVTTCPILHLPMDRSKFTVQNLKEPSQKCDVMKTARPAALPGSFSSRHSPWEDGNDIFLPAVTNCLISWAKIFKSEYLKGRLESSFWIYPGKIIVEVTAEIEVNITTLRRNLTTDLPWIFATWKIVIVI